MAEHLQEEEGLPGLLSDDSYFFSSDEHEEFDSELVDPADEPDGSAPGPEPGAQNRASSELARFERAGSEATEPQAQRRDDEGGGGPGSEGHGGGAVASCDTAGGGLKGNDCCAPTARAMSAVRSTDGSES